MARNNPGLQTGTYTLRGGNNGASYEENERIIKRAFDYDNHPNRCGTLGGLFGCYIDNLSVMIRPNGHAGAGDGLNYVYHCTIYLDGLSYCSNIRRDI